MTVSNNTSTGDDPQIQEAGGISVSTENSSSNNIHIRIVNSIISGNTASGGDGTGGLFFFAIDSVTIASTEINGNSGMYTGGLYTNQVNYFNMSSSLVAENTGLYYGGVSFLATANENPAQITNCTITNNSYTDLGSEGNAAGLMVERVAFINVLNSIITSEQSPAVTVGNHDTNGSAELTIGYSLISDGQDSIDVHEDGTLIWGDGNIDVEPMFMDTANGNYHLLASSQLINGGHPDSTDSDGTVADIGAYPYLNSYSGPTWYITESGNDTTATGSSTDPFRSIQAGINFSSDADSVTVAAGTYVENINWRNVNGIKLIGSGVENCIIDGGQISNVITIGNSNMGWGLIDTSTVISSFTIRNGSGTGGGLHINYQSSPLLENLLITDNTGGHGGGMFVVNGSSPLIRNVVIKDNIGSEGGGIAFHAGGSPKLENVLIHNNTAGSFGGGIYCGAQHMSLTNVTITKNSANAVPWIF